MKRKRPTRQHPQSKHKQAAKALYTSKIKLANGISMLIRVFGERQKQHPTQ